MPVCTFLFKSKLNVLGIHLKVGVSFSFLRIIRFHPRFNGQCLLGKLELPVCVCKMRLLFSPRRN